MEGLRAASTVGGGALGVVLVRVDAVGEGVIGLADRVVVGGGGGGGRGVGGPPHGLRSHERAQESEE